MTESPLPIPLWPGVHQLPPPDAPFPVRWSYEAWEALYGQPWERHWKPWPGEDELDAIGSAIFAGFELRVTEPKPMTGAEIWENICELYRRLREQPLRPTGWADLCTYACPGCGKPRYLGGWCEWCAYADLVHDQRKPTTLNVINIGP